MKRKTLEQRIVSFLKCREQTRAALLTDRQIGDHFNCAPEYVRRVRIKHNIPTGNVLELGYAARRAGLTLQDLNALAQQRGAA